MFSSTSAIVFSTVVISSGWEWRIVVALSVVWAIL